LSKARENGRKTAGIKEAADEHFAQHGGPEVRGMIEITPLQALGGYYFG
jgi:hypothetical protein